MRKRYLQTDYIFFFSLLSRLVLWLYLADRYWAPQTICCLPHMKRSDTRKHSWGIVQELMPMKYCFLMHMEMFQSSGMLRLKIMYRLGEGEKPLAILLQK